MVPYTGRIAVLYYTRLSWQYIFELWVSLPLWLHVPHGFLCILTCLNAGVFSLLCIFEAYLLEVYCGRNPQKFLEKWNSADILNLWQEIRHLCSYLQDLKKASSEEMRRSVYANYAAFIRCGNEGLNLNLNEILY